MSEEIKYTKEELELANHYMDTRSESSNNETLKESEIKFFMVKSQKEAEKKMPNAEKIVKVEGGFMAFESMTDYNTWKKQK